MSPAASARAVSPTWASGFDTHRAATSDSTIAKIEVSSATAMLRLLSDLTIASVWSSGVAIA